jgi:Domain of unknown function DUF29
METQAEQPPSVEPSSHDRDFYRWSLHMAKLIRSGRFEELDHENVAEEIEKVAQQVLSELKMRTITLLAYLLKRDYKPGQHARSLENTIYDKQDRIDLLINDIPSLRRELPALIQDLYEQAVAKSMRQTGLERQAFPAVCPYSTAEVYGEWVDRQA